MELQKKVDKIFLGKMGLRMIVIKNARVFDGEKINDDVNIYISGSKIIRIDRGKISEIPADAEVIDGYGKLVTPGYIDIHMHGSGGYDVMDGTENSIEKISLLAAKHGTTSYLPSTITMPADSIRKSVSAIKNCMKKRSGANILGVHLEGPFINRAKKGAQNEKYILPPSISNYNSIVGDGQDVIKRITLAPEFDQNNVLIKHLKKKGICISAGHTCATLDEFNKSVQDGVTLCTHLFNGMNTLHHRDPGVVGGSLTNENVFVEFIPDLFHVHKDILELIVNAKGVDKCIIITDALSATCLEKGVHRLGDQEVIVTDNGARLRSGSLAGSTIMMDTAVKNMVHKVGISIETVLKMATINSARLLGADCYLGRIKEGYDADINMLNKNLDVEKTILKGAILK